MDKRNITLLGIGGAGCRIIRQIAGTEGASGIRLLAFDSDLESLEESGLPPENRIVAGMNLRSGRGCGGDEILGQRAASVERPRLERILDGTDMLIILGGLGGGMCTGGLPVVLGVSMKLHITTMLMLSLPFAMEGYGRRKLADSRICSDLLPMADCLITLPNDLLFSTLPPETPLVKALELADREMARSALALSSILLSGNLFSADAASFSAVLKRRNALCSLGVGVAEMDSDSPEESAMEKLLLSPLLGGPAELSRADAVIFTVLGGPELSLGKAKHLLELAGAQLSDSPERKILLGAGTSPEWDGTLQLTALTVRYTDTAAAAPAAAAPEIPVQPRSAARKKTVANGAFVQQTLALDTEDKGIMDNTTPDIFDGEDLDIPTFKRHGVFVDQGK